VTREPVEGDLFAIPLPDGEFGVAQALGRRLLAVFQARFDRVPTIDEVGTLDLPVAFRSFVSAMYRRDDRWIRVGRAPVRADLTTPFRCWHCGSDFRGHLDEWRHNETTRDLGFVTLDGAVGASVPSLLPITAELWLFRLLEGIVFSPWWIHETDARSIPWSPPRPTDYLPLWGVRFLPNSIDAPARERLDRIWSRTSGLSQGRPRAVVELLDSSLNLIAELYCMPSDEWIPPIRNALDCGPEDAPSGPDECGRAIAAAFAIGVAGGADLEQGRVPDLVLRVARKAIKPSRAKTLVPAATRGLDRILDPRSAMWGVASNDPDGESIVSSLRRLRDWFAARG